MNFAAKFASSDKLANWISMKETEAFIELYQGGELCRKYGCATPANERLINEDSEDA